MTKILCVGNWESDTGYAWWLMERFWEAIGRRYPGRVSVSFPRVGRVPERLVAAGVQIVEHDFDPSRDDSIEFIRRNEFRHLYLTDRPYLAYAYAKLRRIGVRSIILHDHSPGERSKPQGIKRLVKTIAGRLGPVTADAYIAVSEFVMNRLADCACLPSWKCHLARNGIDLDVDHPETDVRSELGLPRDAVLVVSASRATRYKRIHHIIEAAAGVDAFFIHCGDGPDMNDFKQLIAQRGLNDRFFMLGKRSDVPGILRSANIAVHASAGEVGTSLAILEFMRAGLPIVLPNCPSVAQAVVDRHSGLLYEAENPSSLRDRLNELIARPDLRDSLGAAARSGVFAYDIRHTVDSVLAVFASLRI